MLFVTCTKYNLKILLLGKCLLLVQLWEKKALLSNPALIYLPPCSLGLTVGMERYFLVPFFLLAWSYNREDAAYLTVHNYADDINSRKLSHFLLLNTFSSARFGKEIWFKKLSIFQKTMQKKLFVECTLPVFRKDAELNIIPQFSIATRKIFLCENTSCRSWWFVTLCCNPGGTWNMTKGRY